MSIQRALQPWPPVFILRYISPVNAKIIFNRPMPPFEDNFMYFTMAPGQRSTKMPAKFNGRATEGVANGGSRLVAPLMKSVNLISFCNVNKRKQIMFYKHDNDFLNFSPFKSAFKLSQELKNAPLHWRSCEGGGVRQLPGRP